MAQHAEVKEEDKPIETEEVKEEEKVEEEVDTEVVDTPESEVVEEEVDDEVVIPPAQQPLPMAEIQPQITEEEAEEFVKNGITDDYVRADEIEESHPEVASVINDLGMEFVEQIEALKIFSQATQDNTTITTPFGDISTDSALGGIVGIILVIVFTAAIVISKSLNKHRLEMREANVKAHNSTRDDFLERLSEQQTRFLTAIEQTEKSKDGVWREYVDTLKGYSCSGKKTAKTK